MFDALDHRLDRWNLEIQKTKDRWLARPLFYLHRLKVTGNMLSTAKVLIAGCACFVALSNLYLATVLFLITYIFDVFDGSLARYSGQNSDRGKFIDVLTDQAIYALVVLTMISVDFLNIKALAYSLLVVPVLYLLVVIQKNEGKPTDWIIKPVAKLNYYKSPLFVAAVGVVVGLFPQTFANWILYISNFMVSLHIIYAYTLIINKDSAVRLGQRSNRK